MSQEFTSIRREDEVHPALRRSLPAYVPCDETSDEAFLRTSAMLAEAYMDRLAEAFSSAPPAGWWSGFRS